MVIQEGKRLILTVVTQVLCALLLAANNWLSLGMSELTMTALAGGMATNAVAYIWGQTKTDVEEKK